jgi:hypothetical protein
MSNDNVTEKRRNSLPGNQACVCKDDLYCIFWSIWEVSDSSRSHKEPTRELCIQIYEGNLATSGSGDTLMRNLYCIMKLDQELTFREVHKIV